MAVDLHLYHFPYTIPIYIIPYWYQYVILPSCMYTCVFCFSLLGTRRRLKNHLYVPVPEHTHGIPSSLEKTTVESSTVLLCTLGSSTVSCTSNPIHVSVSWKEVVLYLSQENDTVFLVIPSLSTYWSVHSKYIFWIHNFLELQKWNTWESGSLFHYTGISSVPHCIDCGVLVQGNLTGLPLLHTLVCGSGGSFK